MPYNIEYHKALDRSHILPNLLNGARMGILSQFLSDIILSLLLFNQDIVIKDIRISRISSYYAAVASGITYSVLAIFMDPFAIVLFSNAAYSYVLNLVNSELDNTDFNIRPREIIFDSGVSILLLYAFDPTAHSQYRRYWQKRCGIEPTIKRSDRNIGLMIFFIVLTNTYGFLKIVNPTNGETNNNEC